MKTVESPRNGSASTAVESLSAAHLGAPVFGIAGACLVLGTVAAILTGTPAAAHGFRPLSGLGDAAGRIREMAPLLSVVAAAVLAAIVAILMEVRRLRSVASGLELVVLGAVIVIGLAGASGRFGYATDGGVLPAAVMCMTGGVAVLVAGVVAALGRD